MSDIIVIAHNIRSTHNIGSLFRTCDGFGVRQLVLSGYSPYPKLPDDTRLPHIREKLTAQIHKTALGAEETVPFCYTEELDLEQLKREGYTIVALEQSASAHRLPHFTTPEKVVLLLGEEVEGISPELLYRCDEIIEIPMNGSKESFNVSVAAGIALYHLALVGVE